MQITVSAFYKFVTVEDPEALRDRVAPEACRLGIKGTILIAREGINATICGDDAGVRSLLAFLRADPRFDNLVSKESYCDAPTFRRLKVKVKPEIVTFGHPDIDPIQNAGTYVAAEQWNALIAQPDVLVIDTRNTYEYAIGTFNGAIDPHTKTFREFADFVDLNLDPARDKKVAMFCTGGIRCEKATAYLRARGFDDVYHLEGGILKYLEVIPESESLWTGECFIFDDRVALEHGVTPGQTRLCRKCGFPHRDDMSAQPGTSADLCQNCSNETTSGFAPGPSASGH
jgi:UPF0176 protein